MAFFCVLVVLRNTGLGCCCRCPSLTTIKPPPLRPLSALRWLVVGWIFDRQRVEVSDAAKKSTSLSDRPGRGRWYGYRRCRRCRGCRGCRTCSECRCREVGNYREGHHPFSINLCVPSRVGGDSAGKSCDPDAAPLDHVHVATHETSLRRPWLHPTNERLVVHDRKGLWRRETLWMYARGPFF